MIILKVQCLLREDPFALVAPTNQPRIKCEKLQLSNTFESIIEEDVQFSVVVEHNVIIETKDFVKAFKMMLCAFYIFNLEYPKKLEATFLLYQKLFLRINDKSKIPAKVLKLMSDLKKKKNLFKEPLFVEVLVWL